MRQYIEPFVVRRIATCQAEDEINTYYDTDGEIVVDRISFVLLHCKTKNRRYN